MEIIKTTKYLVFIKEDRPENKKTDTIIVSNIHHNQTIGYIKWYSNWRQYCFFPYGDTIWNTDCLEEINNLIKDLMNERKAPPTAKRKTVGVISYDSIDFNIWVNDSWVADGITKYVLITKPLHCDGYRFDEIIVTAKALNNPKFDAIKKCLVENNMLNL
jgi:hypothetical protein